MYKDNDLLVNGKYLNTMEVFEINKDAKISIEKFGNQKIIVVDDFYSNPDLVRYISLNSYASKLDNVDYPGFRSSVYTHQLFNVDWYTNLVNNNYKEQYSFEWQTLDKVNFNLVKSSKVYNWDYDSHGRACHPHIDKRVNCKYGAVVYLNTENEFTAGVNGTAFYKHIDTGISDCNWQIQKYYRKSGYKNVNDVFYTDDTAHCSDWVNDGNKYWEMIYMSQMKYNRLVLYPGTYFHQSYFNNNDFDNPNSATGHRIVQAIFLHGVLK